MSVRRKIQLNGSRLRALRKQRGLSANQLAHQTDLTPRHIARLESNQRPTQRPSPWLASRWGWAQV